MGFITEGLCVGVQEEGGGKRGILTMRKVELSVAEVRGHMASGEGAAVSRQTVLNGSEPAAWGETWLKADIAWQCVWGQGLRAGRKTQGEAGHHSPERHLSQKGTHSPRGGARGGRAQPAGLLVGLQLREQPVYLADHLLHPLGQPLAGFRFLHVHFFASL